MTDDDQDRGGFMAPLFQRPTPPAVKAAGQRLSCWANDQERSGAVDVNVPLLDRPAPDDEQLAKDFRLLKWFVALAE